MSQVTYYVALPSRYLDGEIIAGEPQECRDRFKARSVAAILTADPLRGGGVFSEWGSGARRVRRCRDHHSAG